MKRDIFAALRVAPALLLLASTICSAETIKIAVSVGLSGPNAIYGTDMQLMALTNFMA